MQVVALDVADNLAVQVNLVQMAGTIIQFVDGTSVRQGGANKLAGSVVLEICDNFNVCQQVQNMLLSYFISINKVGWVLTSAVNQKAIMDYWRNYTFLYSRLSKEKIHKIIYKQFRRKIFV